jgi:hypothetical protein
VREQGINSKENDACTESSSPLLRASTSPPLSANNSDIEAGTSSSTQQQEFHKHCTCAGRHTHEESAHIALEAQEGAGRQK